jgi:hypothetical protein
MRGRTLVALAALVVVDVAVLALGYRAHTGSLPPFQRSTEAFEVGDSPATLPSAAPLDEDTVGGPVLLGVNPAGDVLRATRGACEERFDNPARMWTGNVDDGDRLTAVEAPLREVLGLMVYANGSLRVSGLDDVCKPVTFESTDAGATWQASDAREIWTLSGDTTASMVTGPDGSPHEVLCPVVQIVNLPRRQAVASCSRTSYFTPTPEGPTNSGSVPDYVDLSVAPGPDEGDYFVFGSTSDCPASVGVTSPADQEADEQACLDEGKAPLAIASAEGLLVIQLGNDLRVSRDDGVKFETVGEPSAVADTAAATY